MDNARRRALRRLGWGMAGVAGMQIALPGRATPTYPSRAVRLIMPYAAGGTGDVVARLIAEGLAKTWQRPVLVDNKPGAGGMIGADLVAKSEPDGYTLLMALTGLVQAPSLYGKAAYNPVRDFAPISELATSHLALVVQQDFPARNAKEFAEHVARQGQPLPYGTYGLGSSGHLQMEIFARATGISLVHVPYKGEGPLVNDLLGRQIPAGVVGAVTARQYAQAGKLRPLAVAGGSRSPLLPDVPTFRESGYAGLERQGWIGLFAPASTPRDVVDKISRDVNRVIVSDALRARLVDMGIIVKGSTPSAFADVVRAEQEYWADAIRAANIRLE
ncbi:tripartite tricarboxylate transporter substrate binding protein [Cupriavidus metallidurans]|uniref:Bug family tripartite tricarboxylate transporter substrate binding protein n=1 Tax=Cupriavidus TaxID=106589 RepID=UPI000E9C414E|nr:MULTISPECIES: tripartite tricarboxylate transporter substrate binding protein [unclassified Cupriavidus]GMG92710.1 hypothetical protein Cmtc_39300 [Cupriavidus sp. TKC]HBD37208.1 ABC transporter substrate-binding protein [Cupriavidus sp.]